jgi:CRP/FNR family transcriptional regulator
MEHQSGTVHALAPLPAAAGFAQAGRPYQGALWSTLEEICALLNLPATSHASGRVLFQRVQYRSGQRIGRIGQAFDTLYAVNAGFLKTAMADAGGNEQVLCFPMKGDMIGMDAIHGLTHPSETLALSDCDLIVLPFARLNKLSRVNPDIEHLMYRMMSRELSQRQQLIGMLGAASAEARVARFLIALSDRYAALGYPGKTFSLRMTRQDIGSYLGLTLETVSRTFSIFNESGLIAVHHRSIAIIDAPALRALCRLDPAQPAPGPHASRKSATASRPKPSASR